MSAAASVDRNTGKRKESRPPRVSAEKVWACLLIVLIILICALPYGWPASSRGLLCVAAFGVLSWTFQPFKVDTAWTALMVLVMLSSFSLSFEEAFNGASQSAVWQIYAGMVIGIALKKTPMNDIVKIILMKYSNTKFQFLFLCVALASFLIIIVPSSVVRVLILSPMSKEIMELLRVPTNRGPSSSTAAIQLSLCVATVNTGAAFLTSTAPNLVLESGYYDVVKTRLAWGLFAVYNILPLLIVQMFIVFACIWVVLGRKEDCIPDFIEARDAFREKMNDPKNPMLLKLKTDDKKIIVILFLCVALWATDIVNRIPPVLTALGAVLLLTFPRLGPLKYEDLKTVNISPMILMVSGGGIFFCSKGVLSLFCCVFFCLFLCGLVLPNCF